MSEDFKWNHETIIDWAIYYSNAREKEDQKSIDGIVSRDAVSFHLMQFKKSKMPSKERIYAKIYIDYDGNKKHLIELNQFVPIDKFPKIAAAIEMALNDDLVYPPKDAQYIKLKHTDEQLREAEEKAFRAGRQVAGGALPEAYLSLADFHTPKYPTFQDFINSPKQNDK